MARDRAWWHVLERQKLQPTRGGACEVVFGHSWLGFSRDWLFSDSNLWGNQLLIKIKFWIEPRLHGPRTQTYGETNYL